MTHHFHVDASAQALIDFFEKSAGRGPHNDKPCLQLTDSGVTASYRELKLTTAFQPLLDAQTLNPVAFEALLRARDKDGHSLSPEHVFRLPSNADGISFLDRLCRVMHAANFAAQAQPGELLYLNIHGKHLTNIEGGHGQTFETLLGYCGLSPSGVVLEILESDIADENKLIEAVKSYQAGGYRIAIDDFGCKYSNFDRLWKMAPDIVKLDRSLITQSFSNSRAQTIMPKLVELLHDLGAKVVCEGIETEDQHRFAVDAGSDLVQGFLYARPEQLLHHGRQGANCRLG